MNTSFCSIPSQTGLLFNAAPFPSFDKINTVWQSKDGVGKIDAEITKNKIGNNTLPSFDKINLMWLYKTPKKEKSEGADLGDEESESNDYSYSNKYGNMPMSRSKKEKRVLPPSFEPSPYTVICGRTQDCYNSTGNRRFRLTVKMFLQDYIRAEGKSEKSEVVSRVLEIIEKGSDGASFVTFDNGRWFEVSERVKREKIGGYFRELLPNTYKSSAKAKQAKKAARTKALQQKHLELRRHYNVNTKGAMQHQHFGLPEQFGRFSLTGNDNVCSYECAPSVPFPSVSQGFLFERNISCASLSNESFHMNQCSV